MLGIIHSTSATSDMKLGGLKMPLISPKEILIKVMAAGVNPADIDQRKGNYGAIEGESQILGLEVAGIVSKVGDEVKEFKLGDRVMALLPGGGYAQFAKIDSRLAFNIPDAMGFEAAAAIPESLFTAWKNIFHDHKLKPNETILIHGASGGVGSFAVQLAKSIGAEVISITRSTEKVKLLKDLGSTMVINSREENFEAVVKKHYPEGVNMILDFLGGEYFKKNLALLGNRGKLIHIDCVLGEHVPLDLGLVIDKSLIVTGALLKPLPLEEKALLASEIKERVLPLLERNNEGDLLVYPIVGNVFPLEKAGEAHDFMEGSRQRYGKVILSLSSLTE